jgi:hypothetical protein
MTDTLHVRRHAARYRIPRGADDAGVRAAFDTALASMLAEPLAARPLCEREGMWLIRRLEVHACVGTDWTARRVAAAVAARIAGELASVLERGADGDTVLWFPDRAALVAQFLVDCAHARPTGRWEYAAFEIDGDGSTAARHAITRAPDVGLAALVQLSPSDLGAVLATLSAADADAVLRALDQPCSARGDPVPLVLAAVRRLVHTSVLRGDPRLGALAILADVTRYRVPPRGTASRACDAAELAVAIARAPNDTVERIARAVELGDWRAVVDELGARAMEALTGLVAWPHLARADLVHALTDARAGRPADPPPADEVTTQLGGMFLLLPLLDEYPWSLLTSTWPALEHVEPSALAQYLAVVGGLGPAGHAAAARDAVLRIATGVPYNLDVGAISAWSGGITPEDAESDDTLREFVLGVPFSLPDAFRRCVAQMSRDLLRALARRLPGFADASPSYLWENVLACSATVTIEPDRFVVRMTNPPLGVLLSLTGLNRRRFRLDATGDTEWLLTQAS